MFKVMEPVEISFQVASDRKAVHDAIVGALTARGGRIEVDDGSTIVAGFGSNWKIRLFGAVILGVKAMPRETHVRIEPEHAGSATVSVVVRDTFGFGTRAGLSDKLYSLMREDAFTLKKCFPSAE